MESSTLEQFIEKRPHFVWYVDKKSQLSAEAVVEAVLNYGDWEDVQEVFRIVGLNEAAAIFTKKAGQRRNNFRPRTSHYFSLYFKKHAHA